MHRHCSFDGYVALALTARQPRGSGTPPILQPVRSEQAPQWSSARRATPRRRAQRAQQLLREHPPAVGEVLQPDPSLMSRPDYLAPYPRLAAFLKQHPEIARNPRSSSAGSGTTSPGLGMQSLEMLQMILGGRALRRACPRSSASSSGSSASSHRSPPMAEAVAHADRGAHEDPRSARIERGSARRTSRSPAGRRFLESAPITLRAGAARDRCAGLADSLVGAGRCRAGGPRDRVLVRPAQRDRRDRAGFFIIGCARGRRSASASSRRRSGLRPVRAPRPVSPAEEYGSVRTECVSSTLTDMERAGRLRGRRADVPDDRGGVPRLLRADGAAGLGVSGADDGRRSPRRRPAAGDLLPVPARASRRSRATIIAATICSASPPTSCGTIGARARDERRRSRRGADVPDRRATSNVGGSRRCGASI